MRYGTRPEGRSRTNAHMSIGVSGTNPRKGSHDLCAPLHIQGAHAEPREISRCLWHEPARQIRGTCPSLPNFTRAYRVTCRQRRGAPFVAEIALADAITVRAEICGYAKQENIVSEHSQLHCLCTRRKIVLKEA